MHASKYPVVLVDTDGHGRSFHSAGQGLARRGSHPHFFDGLPLRAAYSILYTQITPHTAVAFLETWATMA
jgi:hypothetical protein